MEAAGLSSPKATAIGRLNPIFYMLFAIMTVIAIPVVRSRRASLEPTSRMDVRAALDQDKVVENRGEVLFANPPPSRPKDMGPGRSKTRDIVPLATRPSDLGKVRHLTQGRVCKKPKSERKQ
jgi:hypothetical protein